MSMRVLSDSSKEQFKSILVTALLTVYVVMNMQVLKTPKMPNVTTRKESLLMEGRTINACGESVTF